MKHPRRRRVAGTVACSAFIGMTTGHWPLPNTQTQLIHCANEAIMTMLSSERIYCNGLAHPSPSTTDVAFVGTIGIISRDSASRSPTTNCTVRLRVSYADSRNTVKCPPLDALGSRALLATSRSSIIHHPLGLPLLLITYWTMHALPSRSHCPGFVNAPCHRAG